MLKAVCRAMSVFCGFFSVVMLLPMLVGWYYQDGSLLPYVKSFFVVIFVAILFRLFSRFWDDVHDLRFRDGFVVVVLVWLVLGLMAGLPFAFSPYPGWALAAFFEGVSGITTTGAEGLVGIDTWPHALRFYHQELELIGGLGVVLLALSMMPVLGVGNIQLYRLDSVGPVKGYKLTPRLVDTARMIWMLYLGFAFCCMVLFRLFGMTWFEAVCESFSTVSTGGFSIYQDNFRHYPLGWLHVIAVVFMLLSALNFNLHFRFFRRRDWFCYFSNNESRSFFYFIALLVVLVIGVESVGFSVVEQESFWVMRICFTVVSMFTTTGLQNSNFALWPIFLPVLMMLIGMIGGCAGSTSGGIKILRFLFFRQEAVNSLRHLLHPRSVVDVSFSQSDLPQQAHYVIRGFLYVYVFVFLAIVLAVMATGLDFYSSVAAVAACLSNTGAGIAGVSSGYADLSSTVKVLLMFAMLVGRIEIMVVMVLFLPSYWRG